MGKNTIFLTRSAFLLALAAIFPLLGLPQPVTGVAVNTILYVSAAVVGPAGGIIIGCITPWLASLRGVLPPPLIVAAPFIMLGNVGLVLFFHYFRNRVPLIGILGASLVKFSIIILGARLVIPQFFHLSPAVVVKAATLLGLTQLFTALGAGVLTWIILQAIPGKYLWENVQRNYRFY